MKIQALVPVRSTERAEAPTWPPTKLTRSLGLVLKTHQADEGENAF